MTDAETMRNRIKAGYRDTSRFASDVHGYLKDKYGLTIHQRSAIYIEAWNGELPYFLGSDIMPFLQLPTNMTAP